MNEFWQTLRYVLIGGGAFMAGRWHIPADQVPQLADQIISILSGGVSLGTAIWGLYIKFRTVSVPVATGERRDVPTVSPVTGSVIPTPSGAVT